MAGGLLFGVFFVAGGFAGTINGILRTRWGNLINVSYLVGAIWESLFPRAQRGGGFAFYRAPREQEIPVWCCWLALLAICGLCLYLLSRKIRGAEVVR